MKQIDLINIKNIIFDLGVVLLDLDFKRAKDKFFEIGLENFDTFYTTFNANSFFHDFETGKINKKQFITEIKKLIPKQVDDKMVKEAWEAVIVGFPNKKIDFIKQISLRYKIFMLSNTNSIHAKKYEKEFKEKAGKSLHQVFNKIYYSHEIGIRKPDLRTISIILKENDLNPQETLFIDDIEQNLEPARNLLLKTYLYKKN